MADAAHCQLPYPERFTAACEFVAKYGDGLSEESKLLLYSLHQQATVGPCNEPKPWGWSVVNNAKWQSWKQLGDMPAVEAMRLYVRTLEEEVPEWWTQQQGPSADANGMPPAEADANRTAASAPATAADKAAAAAAAPPAPAGTAARPMPKSRSVTEVVVEGSWVSPYISSEKRPPPRYEHASALIGSELFIVGGNYGGRYLNDTWALNLENLTWRSYTAPGSKAGAALPASTTPESGAVPPPPAPLPAVAGHVAVPWQGNVVIVGGHMKAKEATPEMPVRMLDTKTSTWSAIECSSAEEEELPRPRGGHSGVLVGRRLFVFGGEDVLRRPLGELLCLDLATMQWSTPETTGKPPGPRSAHAAALYRGRYMLVFGGGSVAHCNNELHVLDLETMEWSQPEAEGPVPPPRAGHAGSILGDVWFIVGGGNNSSGCADMYALDLSQLGSGPVQWTLVGNTPVESAIASEGLSLLPVPMAGCVVSFGGYNGRYHNAVHVYRPEGFLLSGSSGSAAAAAEAQQQPAAAKAAQPPAAAEAAAAQAAAAAAAASSAAEQDRTRTELEAARKEAAAAKEAVAHEMAIMRRQLESAQAAAADAEKALEEVRAALEAEQGKSMRLEVELAEAKQQLGKMQELERELQKYRQSSDERKGSGIWGYISGQ